VVLPCVGGYLGHASELSAENNIRGNLTEIGVFKGKSAAMAALHSQTSETCVLVDAMPLDEVRQ
jgi:hypothetical protein